MRAPNQVAWDEEKGLEIKEKRGEGEGASGFLAAGPGGLVIHRLMNEN